MYGQIPYVIPGTLLQGVPQANAITKSAGGIKALLNKINLSSILSTTQKTLNVVNQAIPLYYQVKPVFKNLRTLGKIGKELNKVNNNDQSNIKKETKEIEKENEKVLIDDNYPNPTFFL